MWKLSNPFYGLSIDCKDWYLANRDFSMDATEKGLRLVSQVSFGHRAIPPIIPERVGWVVIEPTRVKKFYGNWKVRALYRAGSFGGRLQFTWAIC